MTLGLGHIPPVRQTRECIECRGPGNPSSGESDSHAYPAPATAELAAVRDTAIWQFYRKNPLNSKLCGEAVLEHLFRPLSLPSKSSERAGENKAGPTILSIIGPVLVAGA